MNTESICSTCGRALEASAPGGLCPECLIKVGLGSGVDLGADTQTGATRPGFVPPSVAELAKIFPQLAILELIGKGGMGAVYKARQTKLNRIVALKILPPDISNQSAFAQRFTREAQALAQLNHPGIVTLYEFGEASGLYYFLMEFVDGVNLRQLMHAGRVSAREALTIVPQICDALQYAHDQGIVHRDIKPENILLDRRGRVKVADFGLAKIIGTQVEEAVAGGNPKTTEAILTDASKIMGTPQYMSPEQLQAPGEVDHRADIYALGVVFYQMLTGELPGKKLEPPSKKVAIDVRLDEVVLRALEKRPELRYQRAGILKTQIETIASSSERESAQTAPSAAAGSESRLTPSSMLIKSERGRLGVQESPGAAMEYPAMSQLDLYADRLVISQGYKQRVVPLPNVRGLGESVMNWWMSPAGHRSAGVEFHEAGQRRRFAFLPGTALFRTVADSRSHSAEWMLAIQQAVRSATGRELPINQTPGLMRVRSAWSLIWILLPVLVGLPLLIKLASSSQSSGPAGAQILILLWPLVILLPILAWRFWSIHLRKTPEQTAPLNPLPVMDFLEAMQEGNYARAWDKAAPYFKQDNPKDEWMAQMGKVRRRCGQNVSRKILSHVFIAPETRFEQKILAGFDNGQFLVEYIVAGVQPDGEWRVEKYQAQPATPEAAAKLEADAQPRSRLSRTAIIGVVFCALAPLMPPLLHLGAMLTAHWV